MLDLFSWSHIIILLTVALVVVGPKDLPKMMHMAGKWAGKARGLANEFKSSFDDMARQTELDELRKEIEGLRSHQTITGLEADLNKPLEHPPEADLGLDIGPEPRAGEFKVTEAVPAAVAAPAVVVAPVVAPAGSSRP